METPDPWPGFRSNACARFRIRNKTLPEVRSRLIAITLRAYRIAIAVSGTTGPPTESPTTTGTPTICRNCLAAKRNVMSSRLRQELYDAQRRVMSESGSPALPELGTARKIGPGKTETLFPANNPRCQLPQALCPMRPSAHFGDRKQPGHPLSAAHKQPGHPLSAEMPRPRNRASAIGRSWLIPRPIGRNLCFAPRQVARFN